MDFDDLPAPATADVSAYNMEQGSATRVTIVFSSIYYANCNTHLYRSCRKDIGSPDSPFYHVWWQLPCSRSCFENQVHLGPREAALRDHRQPEEEPARHTDYISSS